MAAAEDKAAAAKVELESLQRVTWLQEHDRTDTKKKYVTSSFRDLIDCVDKY